MISEIIYEQEQQRAMRNKYYKDWALTPASDTERSYELYRIHSEYDHAYFVLCRLTGSEYIPTYDDYENIKNA